ncbi:MAG: hypothetical protein Q9174_004464, partial [Haloplaca sp. 1 TL-2023]
KRRKKGKAAKGVEEGTEESAIGMRVRDRKLGRAAEHEKKPLASTAGATVDVDALWAKLNSAPSKPPSPPRAKAAEDPSTDSKDTNGACLNDSQLVPSDTPTEDTIVIKRTYEFAGDMITEEKRVPKSSAEARLYLQSQAAQTPPASFFGGKPLRRPKKRHSMFEPNPDGIVKGLPPSASKGKKLNVVEKSSLDWASHVDKEGLKDELDVAGKAKDGYLGRMDFLGRSEAKREEDMKAARKK